MYGSLCELVRAKEPWIRWETPIPLLEGALLGVKPVLARGRYSQRCSLGDRSDSSSGYQCTVATYKCVSSLLPLFRYYAGRVCSGKRITTVWCLSVLGVRPSVCLSYFFLKLASCD